MLEPPHALEAELEYPFLEVRALTCTGLAGWQMASSSMSEFIRPRAWLSSSDLERGGVTHVNLKPGNAFRT
jgi:hypothetical protein